jgi:hypothetical protein
MHSLDPTGPPYYSYTYNIELNMAKKLGLCGSLQYRLIVICLNKDEIWEMIPMGYRQ